VCSHPHRFGTLSVHFLCTFMSHAEHKEELEIRAWMMHSLYTVLKSSAGTEKSVLQEY
jgi:hypothetical protein